MKTDIYYLHYLNRTNNDTEISTLWINDIEVREGFGDESFESATTYPIDNWCEIVVGECKDDTEVTIITLEDKFLEMI